MVLAILLERRYEFLKKGLVRVTRAC
ncbi:hypothetical protein SBA5_330071 [Candidatus Sulfotelmatomonas gaucii]|uniref:Uncharacterized protein n=1 Tax=Candidatus Sulfuritelmatomonas gaucii TaxID=2043161 RepID=A0A2N9LFI5_9BACT|nr:hypothetical protein SBA5_330071 [Candidatus Sulfotelmatomonas gaucii]